MKKLFLFAAVLLSSLGVSAQTDYDEITDIDDLALIYIGSQHRNDWTKEIFTPYVVHQYPDGSKSWMFDGFLMIEFLAYNENGVAVSFGETTKTVQGSKKEDWERLLREQLGTTSGYGCRALDELIGELIPELGTPGHKHKVVFSLAVAEEKSDLWGTIDNHTLDFTKLEDRVEGMKWYADLLFEEWEKADFKNLELEGVYWTNESFKWNNASEMAKQVNLYYHQHGMKIYWIPYLTRYTADTAPTPGQVYDVLPEQSADEWEKLGMDVVYIQPNYYFNYDRPLKVLEGAINYADEKSLGLEIEFEGYNFDWNPTTQVRTKYAPTNCGLYDYSPAFYQRFVTYLDQFEENYEFEMAPLSYYSGFQGVYDFDTSGNPKDKEIINRLATLMNRRHVVSGWDSAPKASGIDDITVDDRVLAYGLDGAIYIAREALSDAAVYSLDGTLVYSSQALQTGEKMSFGVTVPCAQGIYVVRVGSRAIKVAVK